MGYCIEQIDSKFKIKSENIQAALCILKRDVKRRRCLYYDGDNIINATSFEDAMSELRWSIGFNENGDVDSICFQGGEFTGEELATLDAIAPYVENDSFIKIQGKDDKRWIWRFTDGHVKDEMKDNGKIEKIRQLVKKIKSYDDVLYMYEGDKIDLNILKQDLWDLLQKL